MKQLQIGDPVMCESYAEPVYDEDGNRTIENVECEPFTGVITGIVRKQEGKYVPGGGHYEDYQPAYLEVSRVVRFWEVRKRIDSKPLLVADDQLETS